VFPTPLSFLPETPLATASSFTVIENIAGSTGGSRGRFERGDEYEEAVREVILVFVLVFVTASSRTGFGFPVGDGQ
jgi:hypothetical protein